jgi:hypothetical protein
MVPPSPPPPHNTQTYSHFVFRSFLNSVSNLHRFAAVAPFSLRLGALVAYSTQRGMLYVWGGLEERETGATVYTGDLSVLDVASGQWIVKRDRRGLLQGSDRKKHACHTN